MNGLATELLKGSPTAETTIPEGGIRGKLAVVKRASPQLDNAYQANEDNEEGANEQLEDQLDEVADEMLTISFEEFRTTLLYYVDHEAAGVHAWKKQLLAEWTAKTMPKPKRRRPRGPPGAVYDDDGDGIEPDSESDGYDGPHYLP